MIHQTVNPVLNKGLNFAISPPVVPLTETLCGMGNELEDLPLSEAEEERGEFV